MALEITGKLLQVLPVQTGEGKNGTWSKGGFVLEAGDRYPKKVCCTVWGEQIAQINNFKSGDMVKASIDVESREYNGRWYTDIRAWRIDKPGMGTESGNVATGDKMPDYNTSQEVFNPSPASDDLPF